MICLRGSTVSKVAPSLGTDLGEGGMWGHHLCPAPAVRILAQKRSHLTRDGNRIGFVRTGFHAYCSLPLCSRFGADQPCL